MAKKATIKTTGTTKVTTTSTTPTINKFEESDAAQMEMGNSIKLELEDNGTADKVCVSFIGLGRAEDRQIWLNIYQDNMYDYKTINLVYIAGFSLKQNLDIIEYALETGKFTTHKACAEEVYICQLLDLYKSKHLWLDDSVLNSSESQYTVDTSDIKIMLWDKIASELTISESSNEQLRVNFKTGDILWLNEAEFENKSLVMDPVPQLEKQPLTLELLQNIINQFNKNVNELGIDNYWCNLGLVEEIIIYRDINTGDCFDLIALDDILSISLLGTELEIEVDDETVICVNESGRLTRE